jgi:hypothetical protein
MVSVEQASSLGSRESEFIAEWRAEASRSKTLSIRHIESGESMPKVHLRQGTDRWRTENKVLQGKKRARD